jgi:hypothetical protein
MTNAIWGFSPKSRGHKPRLRNDHRKEAVVFTCEGGERWVRLPTTQCLARKAGLENGRVVIAERDLL